MTTERDTNDKLQKIRLIIGDMKSDRANWDRTWQEVGHFITPNKDDIYEFKNKSRGEDKHSRLFDGSAEHYLKLLASALHSLLTNPSSQWFELTTGDPELDKVPEVRKWLQELVRKIHSLLNNSNFQSAIHEVYLDLGSFGTGLLRVEEDEEFVFHFTNRPIYESYIRENHREIVDTIVITYVMKHRQAVQRYGKEAFGDKIDLMTQKPDDTIEIDHLIMPSEEKGEKNVLNKKFVSYHVWLEGSVILKEDGFNEFPFMVPRWEKSSGEVYGRSPGMKALPDIKMLNAMRRTYIRGAQKIVDPALMVDDDSVIGRVNMTPGALNSVRGGISSSRDPIKPILTGGRPDIGEDTMENARAKIKEHFFIDQFQLRDGPQMTATEVNTRDDDRIRLLGPLAGRMTFELLQPLIGRLIGIMTRRKELPENMPEQLQGRAPQVFFTSQIAKAQRQVEGDNTQRFINSIAPLIQANPELAPQIFELINIEDFVKIQAQTYGVDENIFKSSKELRDERAARQRQQNQQQEQDNANIAADTLNKASSAVELRPGG